MKYLFSGTLLITCLLVCGCTTSTPPPFDQANFSVDLGYGVKMDFVNISGGTFRMSRKGIVEVELSSFALGKTEVTRAQWLAVMGTIHESLWESENHPVSKISWYDAMRFCEKLTRQEHLAGRLPLNLKFTLPTEAQWEYACRAGSGGELSFLWSEYPRCRQFENFMDKSLFKDPFYRDFDFSGYGLDDMSYDEFIEYIKRYDDGFSSMAPVCSFHPNAWGLYDMFGNVEEWCLDYYYDDLLGGKDPVRTTPNPNSDSVNKTNRIVRGGNWLTPFYFACYYSFRRDAVPSKEDLLVGFRVALVQSTNP